MGFKFPHKRCLLLEKTGHKSVDFSNMAVLISKDSDENYLLCYAKNRPTLTLNEVPMYRMNRRVYGMPQIQKWEELKVQVIHHDESQCENFIDFLTPIHDFIKKDLDFYIYGNSGVLINRYSLIGAFITSFSANIAQGYNVDGNHGYPYEYNINISFDRAILHE